VEVPAVSAADLILPPPAEGSRKVAQRVARARSNAATGPLLQEVARPDAGGLALLRDATDAMHLTRLSPGAAGRRNHAPETVLRIVCREGLPQVIRP
jgi:hypothetical protein